MAGEPGLQHLPELAEAFERRGQKGAAQWLRICHAEIERLRALNEDVVEALKECADSLEAEALANYPDRDDYAIQRRRYERDMAPVRKARALVVAAARQEPSHG